MASLSGWACCCGLLNGRRSGSAGRLGNDPGEKLDKFDALPRFEPVEQFGDPLDASQPADRGAGNAAGLS